MTQQIEDKAQAATPTLLDEQFRDPKYGVTSRFNACMFQAQCCRAVDERADLLAAAIAGRAYRNALAECGNDPERMASHCTAQGDDLDTLFKRWMNLSDAAIEKATQGQA